MLKHGPAGVRRGERGQYLVLFVVLFSLIIGIAAFSIDQGVWLGERRISQKDADAAARAGASVYIDDQNDFSGAELRAEAWATENLAETDLQSRFDAFRWEGTNRQLEAWQSGRTGYPIVDAGMRQLWQTGWMHNRVRMITASFLIKHLMTDWRKGEAWFWDTLVDADPASNPANWQWVAGTGANPRPGRAFNPLRQARRFDPDGAYVRRYVPELAGIEGSAVHEPWKLREKTNGYPRLRSSNALEKERKPRGSRAF